MASPVPMQKPAMSMGTWLSPIMNTMSAKPAMLTTAKATMEFMMPILSESVPKVIFPRMLPTAAADIMDAPRSASSVPPTDCTAVGIMDL